MSSTKATTDAGKSIITGGAPGASRSGTKSAINFPTQNEIESFQNQLTVEKIDQLNKAFIAQKSSSYQETVSKALYRKIMTEEFRDSRA